MKAKRILALIMSVAMIATSSNFALEVQASNITDMPVVIASVSDNSATGGDVSQGDVSEGDVSEGDVSEGDVSEGDVSEGDVSEGDVSEGDVSEGDVSEGDVSEGDVSEGDVSEGDVSEGDVSEGDVSEGDVSEGDVSEGDVSEGDVSEGDVSEGDVVEIDNDHFTVDEDGVLQLKDGVALDSLKGKVYLPKEAVVIPLGIFNKNTKVTELDVPTDSLLEEIEAGAFEGSAIKSIFIPDGVTVIEAETFKDSKLQNIDFGKDSSLEYIGEEAFSESNLVSIEIPGLVTEIDDSAFRTCTELQSVDLNNVETVGASAFKGCALLNVISWGSNLVSVGNSAFSSTGLEKVELNNASGANIESWGENVFEKCEYLSRVVLHKDMSVIPAGMFKSCTALTYIALPANCTVIEEEAFSGCSAIGNITIPANVGVIKAKAFAGCQDLDEVTIKQRGENELQEADIVIVETAFPEKQMTMKGYDGTVEDYADRKGYTFETLYPSNTVSVDVNNDSYGSASVSKKTARQGEVIKVTVTPAANYRLKASTFSYNGNSIDTLVEDLTTSQVFSFVMPEEDVTVRVDFESSTLDYGTLSASFEQTNPDMIYVWNSKDKILTLDKVGLSAKLVVKSSKGASRNPGAWMFDYSSKDSKVAVIDSTGVIYARGTGETTITATMKADTSKKVSFKVKVEEESGIDKFELTYSNLGKAKLSIEEIAGKEYSVIQYTKSNLQKAEKDFTVKVNATAGSDNTSLYVNTEWKSANANIADSVDASTSDNENVICVKKGVTGETAITVQATNGQTGKNKQVLYEESFIIRVMDVTPRLLQSSISLNALCTTATEFDLLSVYGYEVETTGLQVVEAVKEGTITEYEESAYISVGYKNGSFCMELTKAGKEAVKKKGKDITYKKMYIQGNYTYETENGPVTEVFRTPIKSLTLTQKEPKPTIKTSGSINLFFNSEADVADRGEVTITPTVKNVTNATVADYELVSEANYKSAGSEEIDSFANNFVVSGDGKISRSSNELIKDAKGKVVTSGYLKITYEGYEPCYVKIKVPTKTTKPSYVLSKTKATVNTFSNGYEMELQLLDKKTKKPISLADLKELSFDESSSGTTTNLFADLDTEAAKETNIITLKIEKAQKGKAVINVEMDTWNEPLKFTFNLSVTSKAPTVKAKPATLTLNNLCVGKEVSTVLTLSQTDVALTDMGTEEFIGKAALAEEAEKISFSYEDGVLTAVASDEVKAGSYKFRFTPEVTYCNGQTQTIKAFTITVKVVASKLTASLKPATVTLNNLYVGRETVSTSYTIKNLPAGDEITILSDDVEIAGSNTKADAIKDSFAFTFAENDTTISVTQTKELQKTGTHKFKISGLKVEVAGEEVEIQPFTIGVKVISSAPKLTVKASGSLNPNSSTSSIVYTFTTKNVSANIVAVEIKELDTSNGLNKPYDELTNFKVGEIAVNEDGSIQSVEILANDGVVLDAKKTYKLRFGAVYEGGSEADAWTSDIKITPKQVLPKIKTDVTTATLYAGVSMDNPKRSQEVLITKTTQQSSEIASVSLASNTSANLKQALKVTFDPDTQKAKITLLRPDLLKPNTTYTVKFEVRMIGQMANTTGPQFTMKIKVQN